MEAELKVPDEACPVPSLNVTVRRLVKSVGKSPGNGASSPALSMALKRNLILQPNPTGPTKILRFLFGAPLPLKMVATTNPFPLRLKPSC